MFRIMNHIYSLPPSFNPMDKFVPDSLDELDAMLLDYLHKHKDFFFGNLDSKNWIKAYPSGYFLGTNNWIVEYIDLNTLTEDIRNKKIETICK